VLAERHLPKPRKLWLSFCNGLRKVDD
jgi:hypothetical protein